MKLRYPLLAATALAALTLWPKDSKKTGLPNQPVKTQVTDVLSPPQNTTTPPNDRPSTAHAIESQRFMEPQSPYGEDRTVDEIIKLRREHIALLQQIRKQCGEYATPPCQERVFNRQPRQYDMKHFTASIQHIQENHERQYGRIQGLYENGLTPEMKPAIVLQDFKILLRTASHLQLLAPEIYAQNEFTSGLQALIDNMKEWLISVSHLNPEVAKYLRAVNILR